MGDECVSQLALSVAGKAPAEMAGPTASPDEKLKAFSFARGIRWTKQLFKALSAHVLRVLVRKGLANTETNQMARKVRAGLHEARYAVGARADADASRRWAFIEEKGFVYEASREGRGGTITRLQEWLVVNPTDLPETRWGLMGEVLQNEDRGQLNLKLWL